MWLRCATCRPILSRASSCRMESMERRHRVPTLPPALFTSTRRKRLRANGESRLKLSFSPRRSHENKALRRGDFPSAARSFLKPAIDLRYVLLAGRLVVLGIVLLLEGHWHVHICAV